jgi:D-lactate dehydrogenase
MKIALFSSKAYDQEYFDKYTNPEEFQITYYETQLNSDTVNLLDGFDVACVFVNDNLDAAVISKMSAFGVRLIALRCAGFNNIDLQSAAEHKIPVVRVPAYSPAAIAEHSLALILTLNRKTHKAYNRIREGNFSLNKLIGFNLNKKTVGVIGTGQIGFAFCQILFGLGCRVLAFDPNESEALKQQGAHYTDLDTLFRESDIISLHCPLTPQTKHLIGKESIGKMKDGVMIINTSRGALINTADVIQGLSSRKIGFLGIDVYEQEENLFYKDLSESIIQDDYILKLNSFPNVLITAHQAYFTQEAMEEITTTTLDNIRSLREEKKLVNEVVASK